MHTERVSDIIAHFIGYFDAAVEDARMRIAHTEGKVALDSRDDAPDLAALDPDFASKLLLKDYDPGVRHVLTDEDLAGGGRHVPFGTDLQFAITSLPGADAGDLPSHYLPWNVPAPDAPQVLPIFVGPGSAISHITQVNLLQDDDYFDMTGTGAPPLDMRFVVERVTAYANEAEPYTPFSGYERTDSYEGLQAIAADAHALKEDLVEGGTTSLGIGNAVDFVAAGDAIEGTVVDGAVVEEAPVLDDFLPDRGIAAPPEEPVSEGDSATQTGGPEDSLEIGAGANMVANIAGVTTTGIIAPVSAVMGDYHQVDMITQAYVYSDRDSGPEGLLGNSAAEDAGTLAFNIATFGRSSLADPAADTANDDSSGDPVFPTQWRVSVVEGDVCFVQWIEQYNFVTDNDQMVVTTTGCETTILTGGNSSINFAGLLGLGMQYDLVIVGGDVLDMNIISQLSVLYDNDWVVGSGSGGADVQSGDNLLWNEATIHNVGANDRFETMPDYIPATIQAIEDRDPDMPKGLAHDENFEGYEGLNVLYITGNLFDVTFLKQVNVVGDADHVDAVAQEVLADAEAEDATVTIDTGGNAVVNVAEIVDYDSFGDTTYLGGNLYSDAVLIQGGIIEDDDTQPQPVQNGLANEVIAFLDDDTAGGDGAADGVINAGHDLSWSHASPVDVMQTAVA